MTELKLMSFKQKTDDGYMNGAYEPDSYGAVYSSSAPLYPPTANDDVKFTQSFCSWVRVCVIITIIVVVLGVVAAAVALVVLREDDDGSMGNMTTVGMTTQDVAMTSRDFTSTTMTVTMTTGDVATATSDNTMTTRDRTTATSTEATSTGDVSMTTGGITRMTTSNAMTTMDLAMTTPSLEDTTVAASSPEAEAQRIDCFPEAAGGVVMVTEESCLQRQCVYDPPRDNPDSPECYVPQDTSFGFSVTSNDSTELGMRYFLQPVNEFAIYGMNLENVVFEVEFLSDDLLRFKVSLISYNSVP